MQARWICQVLTKQTNLPTIAEMHVDITLKREAMRARYLASARHTIQVDYVVRFLFSAGLLKMTVNHSPTWTNWPRSLDACRLQRMNSRRWMQSWRTKYTAALSHRTNTVLLVPVRGLERVLPFSRQSLAPCTLSLAAASVVYQSPCFRGFYEL